MNIDLITVICRYNMKNNVPVVFFGYDVHYNSLPGDFLAAIS
jgi:hypothetical protein